MDVVTLWVPLWLDHTARCYIRNIIVSDIPRIFAFFELQEPIEERTDKHE